MPAAPSRGPDRRHFRGVNAIGFALCVFFALWLLIFLLSLLKGGLRDAAFPMPAAYVAVGALSLLGTLYLFGVIVFKFMWHGEDLSSWRARFLFFAWTCTGVLFFLSQTIAFLRFGAGMFPHLPEWLSGLYWYMAVAGAVVFSFLMWVNSDGAHLHDPHAHDDEYDDEHEHDEDAYE
ncbi:MAG: hypothetical protein ACYTG6_06510 [Planctomycetota bacterium]|jgi:hypothetical protein